MAHELNAKEFANRLNHCLDMMDAPALEKRRVDILVDLLGPYGVTKHDAQNLLGGRQLPSEALITAMANEFDVEEEWLSGKRRENPHPLR